ncbi:hypothetical protein BIWAKO_02835 [Bosea sp. BIWAKO-01]|nr:hypothetical protein BIWAKO_02835 [Bosea sp. BIWAKO-01]
MLTLNESAHVRLSVPPILKFVDELVVIDGGSTDDTVDYLRSLGQKVRVVVKPQKGAAYSQGWEQEARRQRLQEMCKGEWVFQLDADEVVSDDFASIRDLIADADAKTSCFGVNRVDYAPDLYHAFMPFTAHPSIPRVWRKGSVDWNTGKVIHMTPYLSGTNSPVSSFSAPIFIATNLILHHLHRAYWIGKSKHKIRADDKRTTALSRESRLGEYKFAIERIPAAIVPQALLDARDGQKAALAKQLGVEDEFEGFDPSGVELDAQGFFLPGNKHNLGRILSSVANPIVVVEIGSWLGSSTRFLASRSGGCVIAIDHWIGSEEHYKQEQYTDLLPKLFVTFLANCWEYKSKILPIRKNSVEALTLPIENIDVLYIDGAHDYDSVYADLTNWSPRVAESGVICGDDWLWGVDVPVQRAVKDFAAATGVTARSEGNFWWLEGRPKQL